MQENNLYDLIKHYAKLWYVIAVLTVLGFAGGYVYNNYVQTPLYKSNAKLILVSPTGTTDPTDQTRINNYIELIKSRKVLDPVIAQQQGSISYDDLTGAVDATNQKSTQVIDVAVQTTEPAKSMAIANEITESFKKAVSQLYGNNDVTVVDPAVAAATPFNVNKPLQISIGAFGAFLMGVVLLFFMYDLKLDMAKQPKQKKAAKATVNAKQTKAKFKKSKKSQGIFHSIFKRLSRKSVKKTAAKVTKPVKVNNSANATKKSKNNTESVFTRISRQMFGTSKKKPAAMPAKTTRTAKVVKSAKTKQPVKVSNKLKRA